MSDSPAGEVVDAGRRFQTLVNAALGEDAVSALASSGVLALELDGRVRFVTHRLIGDDEIRRAGEVITSVATQASAVATATRPAT